jgi:hypothetical protein
MRTLSILVSFLFLRNIAFGQTRTGKIEQLLPLVAYIETLKPQTQSLDYGTGFFVAKEVDLYFVTAEHVAKTTDITTSIQVGLNDQNSLKIKILDLVDSLYINNNKIEWITHPNADVALVPVNPNITSILGIPYEIVLNKLESPLRERNLIVFGFPLRLGTGKKVSPISKRYNPSSDLVEFQRPDNGRSNVFYLIDDPSISGMSGGPVFAFPQKIENFDGTSIEIKDNQLLGLVHGTINGGGGGGYGAIVPAKFILETLDLAPAYNGKYVYRYDNGKIWSEVIYKNGFAWEVISNYKENGIPQEKGTLKNGNGTANLYDKDGKLKLIFHYKNGHMVSYEKFN